jgi:hypothetical protein
LPRTSCSRREIPWPRAPPPPPAARAAHNRICRQTGVERHQGALEHAIAGLQSAWNAATDQCTHACISSGLLRPRCRRRQLHPLAAAGTFAGRGETFGPDEPLQVGVWNIAPRSGRPLHRLPL